MSRMLVEKRIARSAFCALALLALAGGARAEVTLTLRAEVTLDTAFMRLADVAEIDGDAAEAARVERVFLGRAPAAGRSTRISREQIRRRLHELGLPVAVSFAGSANVMVVRAGGEASSSAAPAAAAASAARETFHGAVRTVARAEPADPRRDAEERFAHARPLLQEAVRQHAEKHFGRNDLQIFGKIRGTDEPLPKGIFFAEVDWLRSGNLPGTAVLEMAFRDDEGRLLGRTGVRVDTVIQASVAVLNRPLRAGETIRRGDVLIRLQKLRPGMSCQAVDPKALAGRRALRSLRAGQVVTESEFEIPPLVRQGQVVLVEVQGNGFRITERAVAKENGRKGDYIAVVSVNSKQEYHARVIDAGRVDIPIAGRTE